MGGVLWFGFPFSGLDFFWGGFCWGVLFGCFLVLLWEGSGTEKGVRLRGQRV